MKHLVIVLALSVGLLSCVKKETSNAPIVRPVKVATAQSLSAVTKNYAGTVESNLSSNLTFRVAGQVTNLPIKEGERVRKGQLIAEIDPRDYQLEYEANRSAYLTAKAQYERLKKLIAKEAVSQQDVEIAATKYEQTKVQMENSLNRLEDARLKAPFDGTIERIEIDNYQRVNAGQSIARIVNTDDLYVRFHMADYNLHSLRQGHPSFSVCFNRINGTYYQARLREYTDISTDGLGVPVSLWIDDPNFKGIVIKPGFACDVRVDFTFNKDQSQEEMVAVPMTAVFVDPADGQKSVWVVTNGELSLRKVEVVSMIGSDQISLRSGVKAGEQVVAAGAVTLVKGQRVKVLNQ